MIGKVILPPSYEEVKGLLIYLAGPIQGAYDWQADAIKIIRSKAPNINIASPRRNIESYKKGDFPIEMYNEQVDWETFHLRKAAKKGVIMFWLAKEFEHRCDRAYAQTSRFELGEWKIKRERERIKLVVGIEEGFSNRRYIQRRMAQDCPDVKIFSTLEETCEEAIRLAKLIKKYERKRKC